MKLQFSSIRRAEGAYGVKSRNDLGAASLNASLTEMRHPSRAADASPDSLGSTLHLPVFPAHVR